MTANDFNIPNPDAEPYDAPLVCFALNVEWVKFLGGALSDLKQGWVWEGDALEEDIQQRARVSTLEAMIMNASAEQCYSEPPVYEIETIALQHTETPNTNGGTTATGAWTDLPLNSIADDDSGSASLSGNVATTPSSGIWIVEARHVFRCNNAGVVRMRLVGGNTLISPQVSIPNSGGGQCVVAGRLYTTVGRTFKWQYYVTQTQTNTGLGQPMNVAGESEVYGEIFLHRLKSTP